MSPPRAEPFSYVGTELDLFSHARNWKAYWSARVRPFACGDVLEVGAGIGANTAALQSEGVRSWTCLEPDAQLAARLASATAGLARCNVVTGTVGDVAERSYDAILYIDVLEHVEDDRGEMAMAASRLRQGGRLVVLSPAHQYLYSPFDRAIGHYRRYDRRSLRACRPEGYSETQMLYLDSAGMLLSLANRVLLRQTMPTPQQIQAWDRWGIPASRIIDPLLMHRAGKSILAAWTRG